MSVQPSTQALLDSDAKRNTYDFDAAFRRRLSLLGDYSTSQANWAYQRLANKKYPVYNYGTGQSGAAISGGPGGAATGNALRAKIVANAASRKGVPYVWGGESLAEGGFDCSGLVYDAYRNAGINVSRKTAAGFASSMGKVAPISSLQPGDLVAWGKSPATAHHVAIYAGNGMIWEAPRRGVPVRTRAVSGSEAFGIQVSILG